MFYIEACGAKARKFWARDRQNEFHSVDFWSQGQKGLETEILDPTSSISAAKVIDDSLGVLLQMMLASFLTVICWLQSCNLSFPQIPNYLNIGTHISHLSVFSILRVPKI